MTRARTWGNRILESVIAGTALLTLSGCITVNLFPQDRGLVEKKLRPQEGATEKVVFLPIHGFIGDQEKKGGTPLLGGKTDQVRLLDRELEKARRDPHVRAIVLDIDSPGGSVTASDRLYHKILLFRQRTKIPVIAFFGDLGASGAYYTAMGADEVWARPTSVVGSIGVMIANVGVEGLMKKVGVTDRTVASGAEKEMGSPFREMTPEDRRIFEGLVADFYATFLEVVERGRRMEANHLRPLADGRVFTARQALANGLLDRVGYRSDLIDHLKKKLGMNKLMLVTYRESDEGSPSLLGMDAGGFRSVSAQALAGLIRSLGPTPLYFWSPGGLIMK
ncbi:MAG: signal peptide peptidase SppA [Nitrospirae bacterium]|nr:signal peptide peptidase SppA [Nitrospirota bacterium]